ncbi:MAG TPA: hypothetical protein VN648_18585 [Candidatus Methylomirabilis sp.]|nr:hypothetical protein [Candidatus Methylomirabilis sp.]
MSKGQPRDPHKEQFWRGHLASWQQSGLSVRAYCSRHHLPEPSFYAWRRTLTPPQRPNPAATPVTFVPLHLTPPPVPVPLLEVVLRNGRLLRLPPEVPATVVRDLAAALEEPPC